MVKQYELMVLLPSNFTPEQMKTFVTTVTKNIEGKKGKVISFESLGKRQLAYLIKKQSEAFYGLFILEMDGSVVQAFERDIRLMDDVLRSLLIIAEDKESKEVAKPATIEAIEESKEE